MDNTKKSTLEGPKLPLTNPPKKVMMRQNPILYLFLIIAAFFLFYNIGGFGQNSQEKIDITQVAQDIKDQQVTKIKVEDQTLTVFYQDNKQKTAQKEANQSLTNALKDLGVDPEKVTIEVINDTSLAFWFNLITSLLPILFMVAFLAIIMRQAQGASGSLFSFGKSRARLFVKDKKIIKFTDVAGAEDAKQEMEEVVDFLKNPKKYLNLGARIPKGVLLVGPPGTGKTLMARAVAGESGAPFFSIAGSEFMEMLVGVGASRVRDLFDIAKRNAPAIIFIDELDAIGRQRGTGLGGGHDEREQTLNQILVEMDGFDTHTSVIIMGATNRPDVLDPALLRPGRFDRTVTFSFPDIQGRKAIIDIHRKNKPLRSGIDYDRLARRTVGFSGADLENLLNEAAILAARHSRKEIIWEDLEEAATKVKLGPEKKRLHREEERKVIAYHEAGHALVNYYLPHMDPVHRVSIVSRGLALGFTLTPPAYDRYNETKTRLSEILATLMGGRSAEEVMFNEITTGASSDIEKGTDLARQMVVEYGMSRLGPVSFGDKEGSVFLGKDLAMHKNISEQTATDVDNEIILLLKEAHAVATEIIQKHQHELELVATTLLKVETLDGPEFEKLIQPQEKTDTEKSNKPAS